MNNLKTFILMAGLMGLFLLAGQLLGGSQGLLLAALFGFAFNFGMYFFSDRLVLRMYGAQVVTEAQAPELYRMVDRLRQRAGLPMPVVAVAPHDQPNAFATGRNPSHAVVAVTTGILKYVPQEELEGVIAHELAHVKNRDTLISTVAATLAAAIMFVSRFAIFAGGRSDDRGGNALAGIAMMILGPIAAMLIQAAISRQREFAADRSGARIAGTPNGLANALRRLDATVRQIPMDANPATAHMFIIQPFFGGLGKLFSTHPPTEARVKALMEYRPGM